MNGAEYILKKLSISNIKHIFAIPGAHIDPLLVASSYSDVETIICCHELSAGYMADGYSRTSGKIGVLAGIGGPGSNNMITAVNTARIEKVPLLVLTGDVPVRFENLPGFQCANELGTNDDLIFKLITKYSKRVRNIKELIDSLNEAIDIALTPPLGPAHLIIPFDVFNESAEIEPTQINFNKSKYWRNRNTEKTVTRLKRLIISDKKVIFWLGDTLNTTEQSKHIIALAEKFHIPVATSFSAKGAISEEHELSLGNFGYAGSSFSKSVLLSKELDAIIGFDIEQNERNTLNWNLDLYNGKEVVVINYPGTFHHDKYGETIYDNPITVLSDLCLFIENCIYDNSSRKQWFSSICQRFEKTRPAISNKNHGIIEPGFLVDILKKELPPQSIFFVDSGNHRVFAGFYWKASGPARFYSASVVAPLGWALAASIGCKFSREEPVVVFTGDGCMQMHGIELKTAVKYGTPLLVVLNNNSAFGSIYNRFSGISEKAAKMATIKEINWKMFATSFGVIVHDVRSEDEITCRIREFLSDQKLTILNVTTPLKPYIHDKTLAASAFA